MTAAVCGLAGLLFAAPERAQNSLRALVLDVVVTGRGRLLARYDAWRNRSNRLNGESLSEQRAAAPTSADDRVHALEQTCRRLRIVNARLRDELQLAERYGVSPFPAASLRPAAPPAVLRAAIVNRDELAEWRSVPHLVGGRAQGVAESDLVLDEGSPHLDQGSEAGIEPELDVFVGRCVVGRIASVGRWTSTLETIADPRYRALAQIVRPSDQGGSFGTEGILVGAGNGRCKLTQVPTTETVRVGDEVYTSPRDGRSPVPLYYGRVVQVEDRGRNWDITVEPAVRPRALRTVAVLRSSVNSERPLAE